MYYLKCDRCSRPLVRWASPLCSLTQRSPDRVSLRRFRYYFQTFRPRTASTGASHRHLHHWVRPIGALVDEESHASL